MNVEATRSEAAASAGLKDRLTHSFPARVVKRYLDAQGPNWATLIAWNALFALFPMVLITVTILGAVLQDPGISRSFENAVVEAFPGKNAQDQILQALQGVKQNSGIFALVAFVGLLWSGSALFGAIEQALTALYPCKPRDFLRQKLMAVLMMLLFTVLAVPLVLSGALLPALQSLDFVPRFLTTGPAALLIQLGAGVIDATIIFLAIYYVVPNRKQRLRHVLPGAITAGVLLEAFTLLFPLYVKLAGGFNTYGATFALFFLLMTFMFFLGQITMIGGAVNAEFEISHGDPSDCIAPSARQAMRPPTSQVGDGDGRPTTLPGKATRERDQREATRSR
jgi:membrane protein